MKTKKSLRNVGERSSIILNDLDLKILNVLNKSKKEIFIMDVTTILKLSHPSLKKHVRKLVKLGFIQKTSIQGTRKIRLDITKKGKLLLSLF